MTGKKAGRERPRSKKRKQQSSDSSTSSTSPTPRDTGENSANSTTEKEKTPTSTEIEAFLKRCGFEDKQLSKEFQNIKDKMTCKTVRPKGKRDENRKESEHSEESTNEILREIRSAFKGNDVEGEDAEPQMKDGAEARRVFDMQEMAWTEEKSERIKRGCEKANKATKAVNLNEKVGTMKGIEGSETRPTFILETSMEVTVENKKLSQAARKTTKDKERTKDLESHKLTYANAVQKTTKAVERKTLTERKATNTVSERHPWTNHVHRIDITNSSKAGKSLLELGKDKFIAKFEAIYGNLTVRRITKESDVVRVIVNNTETILKLVEKLKAGELKEVDLGDDIKINMRLCRSEKSVVIKGILPRVREKIIAENPNKQIVGVERILTKEKKPTSAIKITVEDGAYPKNIIFEKLSRNADIFIREIIQCSKCQLYCHTAKVCSKETRCRFCAGKHSFEKCLLAKNDKNYKLANPDRKCANCGGNHSARFKGCPEYIKTRSLLKEALEKDCSIREVKSNRRVGEIPLSKQIIAVARKVEEIQKDLSKKEPVQLRVNIEKRTEDTVTKEVETERKQLEEILAAIRDDLKKIVEVKNENADILKRMEIERQRLEIERQRMEEMAREREAKFSEDLEILISKKLQEIIPCLTSQFLSQAKVLVSPANPPKKACIGNNTIRSPGEGELFKTPSGRSQSMSAVERHTTENGEQV
jgi:hypothetical protein